MPGIRRLDPSRSGDWPGTRVIFTLVPSVASNVKPTPSKVTVLPPSCAWTGSANSSIAAAAAPTSGSEPHIAPPWTSRSVRDGHAVTEDTPVPERSTPPDRQRPTTYHAIRCHSSTPRATGPQRPLRSLAVFCGSLQRR